MSNKFIADVDDIPSTYDVAEEKASKMLKGIQKDRKIESTALKLEESPHLKEEIEYESDFDTARSNINNLLGVSLDAVEEFAKLALATDSPRAFEVLNNMMKTSVEMNQKLLEIHQQKEKRKKTIAETAGGPQVNQPGVVNNTQNNIMMSPADIVAMLKNGPDSPPEA